MKSLLCFPPAGSSAAIYRDWPIATDLELIAWEPPGRGKRYGEQFALSIEEMASDAMEATIVARSSAYAIFGHSMGARCAYELARQIIDVGDAPPEFVCVSGSIPPGAEDPSPLAELGDADFEAAFIELGGFDQSLFGDRELLDIVLPIARADCRATESYRPVRPHEFPVPLIAVRGTDDPEVSQLDILGWKDWTDAGVKVFEIPGNHMYITERSSATILLKALLAF